MDLKEFEKKFSGQMSELITFVKGDSVKDIMGVEAVNHFKESFANEGFTDKSLKKWKDVKRRNSNSAWYGHSGQTGRFSNARTNAGILTGETQELRNAISYRRISGGARVVNDKPYARVHNEGGKAMVYGKTPFTMKQRQFMGKSAVLKRSIENKISRELLKRLKS